MLGADDQQRLLKFYVLPRTVPVSRSTRFRLKTLFVATTLLSIAVAAFVVYCRNLSATGAGTSHAIANRAMWTGLELPSYASDVTFYVDQYGCEAEFRISEQDFLDWCKGKGFRISRISSPVPYFQPIALPGDERLVAYGYEFSVPDGAGVFDADRGRAAFYASTFP
jgi:hypothetical protein